MKIIDLLNKIANGEEVPYKIKYNERIYEYAEEIKWYLRDDMKCELSNSKKLLNDEVEILEEPKGIPEKLSYYSMEKIQKAKNKDEWQEERISLLEKRVEDLHIKMNELLDYLESKGE